MNTVLVGVPTGVLHEIRLDCGVGSLLVNGVDVLVRGTTVSAPVTLNARNGSVAPTAATVTGKADLSAKNGSVDVKADQLDDARLESRNGSITAEIGAVGENVFAGVENGMLEFHLTKEPQNLAFHLSGGWDGRWRPDLPKGWHDGYTVGTGKPVLELSAAPNGMKIGI